MVNPGERVTTIVATQLTGVVTHHGEGPGWDAEAAVLRVVDLLAGDLVRVDPASGETSRTHVGPIAAAWRPRRQGGIVVATERGFALLDADNRVERQIEAWTAPTVRMNDGACDPQGRFYCGSMAYDARTGAGTLWRLDGDLSVHAVLPDVTISNGLAWLPDSGAAYYVDTVTQRVDRIEFDADAMIASRDPHVRIDPATGAPDGIAVDTEGGVWVALWGGAAVHRYDRDGVLTHRVEVGAAQVSACAFGGPDRTTLFITTSAAGADPSDTRAGAVFVAETGLQGAAVHAFAG